MPSRRSLPPWVVGALVVTATAAALTVSCRQETILLAPRADTTHTGGTGGGTVQRVPLTLTIKLFPNDTGMGTALGWPSGVVPGAAVTLQRDGSSDTALHAVSDSLGVVTFAAVLTGSYSISALRVVDSTERPRLPAGYGDVDALGSGGRIGVDTPATATNFTLPVSHRGSLLVSEWWFPLNATYPNETESYPFAGYVELYNNSDTTIYLDGLIFGDGLLANPYIFPGSANSCTNFTDMMDDSTGLWTLNFFRFPGTGRDHPVAPGQIIVIATDAVDHRTVNPDASDLSNADFEFIGSSDVDNPAVPNMINLGLTEKALGHGWYGITVGAPFVALPLSTDTLPRRVIYTDYLTYFHIQRAAIISVSLFLTPLSVQPCLPLVNPSFDAGAALLPLIDYYSPSMQRKVLRFLPDGRAVLQNTRTSANDFLFVAPRTPGSVQ